ncbi:MAG: hypothetical protein SV760_07715 [Halobacteria archaeon]|nr:hypothetical protein [Halobacteria archaeon]
MLDVVAYGTAVAGGAIVGGFAGYKLGFRKGKSEGMALVVEEGIEALQRTDLGGGRDD